MGVANRIFLKAVFFKEPELSRPTFNMRLGRWFIRAEETKKIAKEMEQEGLIKIVKRNNQPFYQRAI